MTESKFNPGTKHPPFVGAYRKGYNAAKAGRTKESNPYDRITQGGTLRDSWGALFRGYWYSGWADATAEILEASTKAETPETTATPENTTSVT
jgi:ribosome modulation factor